VIAALAALFACAAIVSASEVSERLLFEERFEDTDWASRGWYDGPRMEIDRSEHGPEGSASCLWRWRQAGDIGTVGGGGRVRIEPVESVTLSFLIKHSDDWAWTGVNWHPHEFHFITDADDPFVGPAYTHLTFYVEAVNGVPRVAVQDGRNIDESRLRQNLVGVTERRAVAGCNGDSDGYGDGTCYRSGDVHVNGKHWEADRAAFGENPGRYDKRDWHRVRARFRLNTIRDGIAVNDGVIQYWFDNELLMDHHDVAFRTGQHPDMKIDQFLMAPYFGPGVPHPQRIWIDDLRIHTDDPPPDADAFIQPSPSDRDIHTTSP